MKRTITIFSHFLIITFFITSIPMLLACSNDDVPVPEDEMDIPGAGLKINLNGVWECWNTDNEGIISRGFRMTIQNGMVSKCNSSKTITKGRIESEDTQIKFGSGPWLDFRFENNYLYLTLKKQTGHYKFSFVRK